MSSVKKVWCRISIEDGIIRIEINAYCSYNIIIERVIRKENLVEVHIILKKGFWGYEERNQ